MPALANPLLYSNRIRHFADIIFSANTSGYLLNCAPRWACAEKSPRAYYHVAFKWRHVILAWHFGFSHDYKRQTARQHDYRMRIWMHPKHERSSAVLHNTIRSTGSNMNIIKNKIYKSCFDWTTKFEPPVYEVVEWRINHFIETSHPTTNLIQA